MPTHDLGSSSALLHGTWRPQYSLQRAEATQILHHCLAFYDDIYRRNEQEKVKAGGRIRQVTDAISALHVNGDTIEDLIIKQAAQSSISLPLQPKYFAKITRGG
ncbi:unnamed protein product [Musa acuminata var. zebrina]